MKTEKVRISGYGDYIAVDVFEGDKLLNTPLYVQLGRKTSVKWSTPQNENNSQPYVPMTDTFEFELRKDGLFTRWADGPAGDNSTWDKIDPVTLPDFKFKYAL